MTNKKLEAQRQTILHYWLNGIRTAKEIYNKDSHSYSAFFFEFFDVVKHIGVVDFNEESLKNQFFKGLSDDNKLEAMRCRLKLPLDDLSFFCDVEIKSLKDFNLVELLEKLEDKLALAEELVDELGLIEDGKE
ncbi:5615_t:CDS:2 [Entrophospora sp. SA101]|nr:5615_t:CDS:2 [Entrophospora sp. SA101]